MRSIHLSVVSVLALGGGVLCVADSSRAAAIVGLGSLPNGASSSFVAMSADGSTIVTSNSGRGFRWRSATGWVDLGDSGAGAITVGGVSGDGNVVTGAGVATRSGVTGDYPSVWRDGAWTFLPRPSNTVFGRGVANAVSGDGSFIAARIDNVGFVGRKWGWNGSGYELVGDFSVVNDDTHVEDMNGDGSLIVGWGEPPPGPGDRAGVSPAIGGPARINMPDGTDGTGTTQDLRALALNAAGTIIVGSYRANDASPWQVWKRESGGATVLLGAGEGVDVSLTGIIAGGAFIFDATGAGHSVSAYLAGGGADVSAWASLAALGVSDDGLTFSGTGLHEVAPGEFVNEAWATTIPGPGGMAMLGALAFLHSRRRRSARR